MIDLIGDVHGHADHLKALLTKLGYSCRNGCYFHTERKALFVGDYIDRGPQVKETLNVVRGMGENENAIALMGNHEYNALCFHYKKIGGGHLRKHTIKNITQHYETLRQFQNKQKDYEDCIDWFKTLPLFYEAENFRAVHACWDSQSMNYLQKILPNQRLNEELIYQSAIEGTRLNKAIDFVLKGIEIRLPDGLDFEDKDGAKRSEIRIKWWENPSKLNYNQISIAPIEDLQETAIEVSLLPEYNYYNENNKAVFFGHYWLSGNPAIFRNNICCLDYSVAKHGYLVAYQFDEEKALDSNKLVYV